MRKTPLLTLAVLIILAHTAIAQHLDASCAVREAGRLEMSTLPWYGNNNFLDNVLEEHHYHNSTFDYDNALYRIPVKFWVYRNKSGKGGAERRELRKMMQNINYYNILNNTGVLYYMLPDVGYIDKGRHLDLGYYWEAPWQTLVHHDKGCMNVFVVDEITKRRAPWKRRLTIFGTYNKVTKAILITRKASSTSLAHEAGHFLGLYHPHRNYNQGKCRQEAVSRTRRFKGCLFKSGLICEKNGDGLCDTPAEPNLGNTTNNDCEFTGITLTDNWGDNYEANVDNIMSYPKNRACRDDFTDQQIAVMLYTAKQYNICEWDARCYTGGSTYKNQYTFDQHEPNDWREMASPIELNEPQRHTFHQVYVAEENQNIDEDMDWIKFFISVQDIGKVTVTTSSGAYEDANVKITLYDDQDNRLGADVNSGEGTYAKFEIDETHPGWYYVKVEKLNTINAPDIGSYTIEVIKD